MAILCTLLQLYVLAIFVRIVLSWFPISPDSVLATAHEALHTITEPVLGPVRRLMPGVGFGGMGLDLSPIIVLFAIQFLVVPIVC